MNDTYYEIDDDLAETDERPTVRMPLRMPTERLLEEAINHHHHRTVTIRESKRRSKNG